MQIGTQNFADAGALTEGFLRRQRASDEAARAQAQVQVERPGIEPTTAADRTRNPLRPHSLAEVVGQPQAKSLMSRAIESCKRRDVPLDHVLLVAASGTGKSTFSHAIANDLGVDVYELEAPVSFDTLLELRETMKDGDILKIEEIHQQGIMERRGKGAATQPEVLYAVMEDRVLQTPQGVLPFPSITIIGTTTDEGMLPDAFINRFSLRPVLEPYGREELEQIVVSNARALELRITWPAVRLLADASRGVPRQINNLVKNAAMLTPDTGLCNGAVAHDVLLHNGLTTDGLSRDMQGMLTFLYLRARRVRQMDGQVTYQASVQTIATAIGKSRDSKAINIRVEPYLIEQGYLQVTGGGRMLTDAGVDRARALVR